MRGQGRIFNTELTYNVDSLKDEIDEIASEINRDPVDATVTFNPEDKEMFIISPEKNGLYLDVDIVIDQIRDMLDSGNVASPIVLSPKSCLLKFWPGTSKVNWKNSILRYRFVQSSEDRTKNVVTAALAFNGESYPRTDHIL